jgi:hypothetical protein
VALLPGLLYLPPSHSTNHPLSLLLLPPRPSASRQFPHFNALSWNLRPDYSKAGYRMMSVTEPSLNARVALRHSLLLFPISLAMPYLAVTSPYFLLDSTLLNGYMAWCAFRFWRESNDQNARSLFFASLIHLPVYLALLMMHKRTLITEGTGPGDGAGRVEEPEEGAAPGVMPPG